MLRNVVTLVLVIGACLSISSGRCYGAVWYVDCQATGQNNGTSWNNAWTSFAGIVWGTQGVSAGDTLYISGGQISKTYTNMTLAPGVSGTLEKPITIQIGQESPHNGSVIIDKAYNNYFGISLSSVSYVNISGQVGTDTTPRIKVTNATFSGINVSGSSHHIDMGYIEVFQNSRNGSGSTQNLQFTVTKTPIAGSVHNCIFHDNFFGDEVWLNPNQGGVADTFGAIKFFDNEVYGFHADGIKILNGGVDFYNNKVHDRGLYQADHPDGIQGWGGYLRIWGNHFYNFHRNDDNNVNSYIRYNPDGASGHDADPKYVFIFNNIFTDYPPFTYSPASVVTHNGITYTASTGHYSKANNEPGIGTYSTSYWSQKGSGGAAWAPGVSYTGPDNVRRGLELSFGDSTLSSIHHVYVVNNIFCGIPLFGLYVGFKNSMPSNSASDIVIANNVFKDVAQPPQGSAAIIIGNKGDGSITYGSVGSGANVIVDYNSLYASSSSFSAKISYLGSVYTHAEFVAASGCQAHGLTSDPSLGTTFVPASGSPLIAAGANFSNLFTTDKAGEARPTTPTSAWTIGAYEVSSTTGIEPTAPSNLRITN